MSGKFRQSAFFRDLITLTSGTVMAQALPMAVSPVMSRVFTPTDYGVLGIYMAFTGILGVLVTSQYNHAIMLPEDDDESTNLVALCCAISLAVAVVVLGLVAFNNHVHPIVGAGSRSWFYLVPLSVVMSGWYSALSCWTNKKKKYKRLSISRLGQALVTIAIQLTVGLQFPGPMGLVFGLVGGQLAVTLLLTAQVWREDQALFRGWVTRQKIKLLAVKHKSFAQYLLPADLLNSFTNQVPTLLLSRLATTKDIGAYNFSQRILGLPSALIASAIVEVFRQQAISDYNTKGNCRDVYIKTGKLLALLGLPPLVVVLVAAPQLFSFVFGDRWRDAGVYAQILSVMFYLRFVVSPLAYVYYIARRQREDLLLHIVMVIGAVAAIAVGYVLFHSPKWMIGLFSINYSLIYLLYLVRSYTFCKGEGTAT